MSSIFCKQLGEYKTHPIAVYLSYNNYALRITHYELRIYFLSTISEQTRFENASGSSIGIPSIRSASV